MFQSNADRFYVNGRVKISSSTIKMFKKWKNEFPHSTMDYDSRFVSLLLINVFNIDILRRSSATGKRACNGVIHDALDPVLLKFVKGL